jgi:hypothetical protein
MMASNCGYLTFFYIPYFDDSFGPPIFLIFLRPSSIEFYFQSAFIALSPPPFPPEPQG